MANKWAIQNGNWSDGSTWNDGVVPTADDDVWLNGKIVNVDLIEIVAKTINNYFNEDYESGGYLNQPSTLTNNIISANINGDISVYIISSSANVNTVINGNLTNVFFYSVVNGVPELVVNGNVDRLTLQNTSGGGSHSNTIEINGNAKHLYFVTNRTLSLSINGSIEIDSYLRSQNWERAYTFNSNGVVKIISEYIMNEFNYITLSGQIDLSEANKTFPFVPRNYITIPSEITIINKIVPPESVVLEGYQYGDKVGTLKTVQGTIIEQATVIEEATVVEEASVVNLTEQEVNRVKNCATVSTVQKCFEDFKEE